MIHHALQHDVEFFVQFHLSLTPVNSSEPVYFFGGANTAHSLISMVL